MVFIQCFFFQQLTPTNFRFILSVKMRRYTKKISFIFSSTLFHILFFTLEFSVMTVGNLSLHGRQRTKVTQGDYWIALFNTCDFPAVVTTKTPPRYEAQELYSRYSKIWSRTSHEKRSQIDSNFSLSRTTQVNQQKIVEGTTVCAYVASTLSGIHVRDILGVCK